MSKGIWPGVSTLRPEGQGKTLSQHLLFKCFHTPEYKAQSTAFLHKKTHTCNLMLIHTLQLILAFKHKHSNPCMHAQSQPGRVTSNINIYTQRKQHILLRTHSCILSLAADRHLVRPGHLGWVWANSATGNPSALVFHPCLSPSLGTNPALCNSQQCQWHSTLPHCH